LSSLPVVHLDQPFQALWAGQDPFAMVEAMEGKVVRALDGRRTFRTEVAGRGYFVKIHRGVGWREIFKNLLSARLPVLGADNEWLASQRLAELGVDSLHAVAFGQRGSNPARRHSFVITEELAPIINLDGFTRSWPQQPPAPALKRALIQRVATMVRRMHEGGVNHRDLYLCHFLLQLDPAPTPTNLSLSLVDLHRAQIRTHTPRRWRDKDLAALHFSSLAIGLTMRDRLRFLRTYFARPLREILNMEAELLGYLNKESVRLLKRYQRKYAPESSR
jgi:heptose I phosphotransferase